MFDATFGAVTRSEKKDGSSIESLAAAAATGVATSTISNCVCPLVLPAWIQASGVGKGVGVSDCVDLEVVAIPSSSKLIKQEAILNNLHQRFKKDFIYVSTSELFILSCFFWPDFLNF